MPKVSDTLRAAGVTTLSKNRSSPLWKGPEEEGITFSMLSRFLCCRERFRLYVVEGLKPDSGFDHRTGYGDMWHVCEEALASGQEVAVPNGLGVTSYWEVALKAHCIDKAKKYKMQQETIDHWYRVCKVQFPIYVEYWRQHADVIARTPVYQEKVFNVAYTLPSGRVVRLRGKWDAVDYISGALKGLYAQENKTKGTVYGPKVVRQLSFDLQTMIYVVALQAHIEQPEFTKLSSSKIWKAGGIRGVRYNVVRRPLSGGKGTIKRHEPTKKNPDGESKTSFYERLGGIIADSPEEFFFRWKVDISQAEIEKFKRECLNPILEQLCDWWDWIKDNPNPFGLGEAYFADGHTALHWRHPFGVYNVLDEGGSSDLDEYLITGSEVGLKRVDQLFTELV